MARRSDTTMNDVNGCRCDKKDEDEDDFSHVIDDLSPVQRAVLTLVANILFLAIYIAMIVSVVKKLKWMANLWHENGAMVMGSKEWITTGIIASLLIYLLLACMSYVIIETCRVNEREKAKRIEKERMNKKESEVSYDDERDSDVLPCDDGPDGTGGGLAQSVVSPDNGQVEVSNGVSGSSELEAQSSDTNFAGDRQTVGTENTKIAVQSAHKDIGLGMDGSFTARNEGSSLTPTKAVADGKGVSMSQNTKGMTEQGERKCTDSICAQTSDWEYKPSDASFAVVQAEVSHSDARVSGGEKEILKHVAERRSHACNRQAYDGDSDDTASEVDDETPTRAFMQRPSIQNFGPVKMLA